MKCHDCQTKTKVEETRVLPENPRWTKRRRVCKNCGFTLWTVEMPAEDVVVKEDVVVNLRIFFTDIISFKKTLYETLEMTERQIVN
jgi:transcriptional regulator NrdR family protein